jgi:hypothetical protein
MCIAIVWAGPECSLRRAVERGARISAWSTYGSDKMPDCAGGVRAQSVCGGKGVDVMLHEEHVILGHGQLVGPARKQVGKRVIAEAVVAERDVVEGLGAGGLCAVGLVVERKNLRPRTPQFTRRSRDGETCVLHSLDPATERDARAQGSHGVPVASEPAQGHPEVERRARLVRRRSELRPEQREVALPALARVGLGGWRQMVVDLHSRNARGRQLALRMNKHLVHAGGEAKERLGPEHARRVEDRARHLDLHIVTGRRFAARFGKIGAQGLASCEYIVRVEPEDEVRARVAPGEAEIAGGGEVHEGCLDGFSRYVRELAEDERLASIRGARVHDAPAIDVRPHGAERACKRRGLVFDDHRQHEQRASGHGQQRGDNGSSAAMALPRRASPPCVQGRRTQWSGAWAHAHGGATTAWCQGHTDSELQPPPTQAAALG